MIAYTFHQKWTENITPALEIPCTLCSNITSLQFWIETVSSALVDNLVSCVGRSVFSVAVVALVPTGA